MDIFKQLNDVKVPTNSVPTNIKITPVNITVPTKIIKDSEVSLTVKK